MLYSSYNDQDSTYISPGAATPINFFRDDSIVTCEVQSGSIKYLSISNIPSDSTQVDSVWSNICGIALPVTWLKVSGTLQGKNILLNWSTASELNASYFSVQHSTNGRDYSEIGHVAAKGNSSTQADYSFTHYAPSNNTHYYRIKQIDKDNHFTYSPVIKITVNSNLVLTVFPNPVKEMITVSGLSGSGVIRLFSLEGKSILEQKVTAQTSTLNLSRLPGGTYFLQYTDGQHSYTQKIFKQ